LIQETNLYIWGMQNTTPVQFPEIISLNVGGHYFCTTLTTLKQDPNTMLAKMFSGRIGVEKDPEGRYFIDRDGALFGLILTYLRDGDIDIPPSIWVRKLFLREAKFYQLQGLIERLERLIGMTNEMHYKNFVNSIPPLSPTSNNTPFFQSPQPTQYSTTSLMDLEKTDLCYPQNCNQHCNQNSPDSNCRKCNGIPDLTNHDQDALYDIYKQKLKEKNSILWKQMKATIRMKFEEQLRSEDIENSTLICRFPLQSDLLNIAPFLIQEMQQEGLRDLTVTSNYQTGLCFMLNLANLSHSDESAYSLLPKSQRSPSFYSQSPF